MAAGKKRKAAQSQQPTKPQHRFPLDADLDSVLPSKKRARAPKQHQSENKKLSSDLTSKIIKEALKQQNEIFDEENREDRSDGSFPDFSAPPVQDDNCDEDLVYAFDEFSDSLRKYDGGEFQIDEEDEKVLATFMLKETGPQLTLADTILQRIKEKDAEVAADAMSCPKMDEKIINMYKQVGNFLHQYTSGKLPIAFKYILSINCWEEVLYLTEPQNWSTNAMYKATKIFASNMTAKRVQIFYQNILLPRIRDDIRKNGKLHFALYQSLKTAFYKPAAFHKGILFPLCESGTCRIREAVIVGSIIQKCCIDDSSTDGILWHDKVLDAVLEDFMSFLGKQTIMPVIWHQSVLSFVQRYKNELQGKDKDILRLLQHQNHYVVTPEIRRELRSSRNRGERDDDAMSISSQLVGNQPIEEDRLDIPEVPMEE